MRDTAASPLSAEGLIDEPHRGCVPTRDLRAPAEAGYNGEPIVVLDGVDLPTSHAHGLIAADLLKKLGFNVGLASADWVPW
jgi:hypothetical protein